MGKVNLKNQAAPETPDSGYTHIYIDSSDKHVKAKDDTGTVTDLTTASGAVPYTIFDTKGDIIAGTGSDTASKLAVGSNDQFLIADSTQSTGLKWVPPRFSRYGSLVKTDNYTANLNDDETFIFAITSNKTLTMPDSTGFPDNNTVKEFAVVNGSANGSVTTLALDNGRTFPNGLGSIKLPKLGNIMRFGGGYPSLTDGWFLLQKYIVHSQYRRNAAWADSNFSSEAGVPWDTTDEEEDDNVVEQDGSNPSRINLKIPGDYYISCWYTLDSTGGGSYTAYSYLRQGGSSELLGSRTSLGNYQREDSQACISHFHVSITTSTYIELRIEHTGLTGNLTNCVIVVEAHV